MLIGRRYYATKQDCLQGSVKNNDFMDKNFVFPEIDEERAMPAPNENRLRRCFSPGSFAVFERCGFVAPAFSRGLFAPPLGARRGAAPKWVRTNSSVPSQIGQCKPKLAASQSEAARTYCNFGLN